jgi:hypothetical protein
LQLALHAEQPSAFDSLFLSLVLLPGEIKINKKWRGEERRSSRKASGCLLHYLAGGGREIYYSVRPRARVFLFSFIKLWMIQFGCEIEAAKFSGDGNMKCAARADEFCVWRKVSESGFWPAPRMMG